MRSLIGYPIGSLIGLMMLFPATQALCDPPPVAAYAQLPIQAMRLSPDGTKLAMIVAVDGRQQLAVLPVQPGAKLLTRQTDELEPTWFDWKTNETLIASLRFVSDRLREAPTVDTRLIAISADLSKFVDLNKRSVIGARSELPLSLQIQDAVVSLLPNDPESILLAHVELRDLRLTHRLLYPSVFQVSLDGERQTQIVEQLDGVEKWLADPQGNVRGGHKITASTQAFITRSSINGDWHTIFSDDINTGQLFEPIAFSASDPKIVYVLSDRLTGRSGIWEVSVETGEFLRSVAAADHDAITPVTRYDRLVGYTVGLDETEQVYLDPDWAQDHASLQKALPGQKVFILDRTQDGVHLLVGSRKDNDPYQYWVLDRSSGQARMTPVATNYAAIPRSLVAPVTRTSFTARDGLTIPVLLTLPVGYKSGPIPFVVVPHDGPSRRSTTSFDYLTQFYASRGYGVLQPQFRGSAGYSTAFEHAGLQEWGLKMQDDVTDATKWLIDQNYADAQHVCIAGWGYGGYSALMGAIKEPKLYRCSIAIAPVTDLHLVLHNLEFYKFAGVNIPRIENDLIRETSPSEHADKIEAPILLIHGRKDYNVPPKHSDEMEAALKDAGKVVEAVYFKDEDHYFRRESDRAKLLTTVEAFLNKNLGPGFTPARGE